MPGISFIYFHTFTHLLLTVKLRHLFQFTLQIRGKDGASQSVPLAPPSYSSHCTEMIPLKQNQNHSYWCPFHRQRCLGELRFWRWELILLYPW